MKRRLRRYPSTQANFLYSLFSLVVLFSAVPCHSSHEEVFLLEDFESDQLPDNIDLHHVGAELVEHPRGKSLEVHFQKVDWPNVLFRSPVDGWNWSRYLGIEMEITNPEAESIEAAIRVDNAGAPKNSNTSRGYIPPGETVRLRCELVTQHDTPLWGMRGIPERGPLPTSRTIDPTKITAFQIFLPKPDREHTLLIHEVALYGDASRAQDKIALPFVDPYGQYIHEDWPGKIHSDEELLAARQCEEEELDRKRCLPDRDALGAWTKEKEREATGWFRTENIDGKWWLISPDGRLFFSNGIDCVGLWQRTFIEGRDDWFEWLPHPEGVFKPMFGYVDKVHSMADEIGGKGRTFGFHIANVFKKYGEEYRRKWRETTYRRFSSWGVNTIGNWSEGPVLEESPLPYVASAGVSGKHRRVEGGEGYWGKIHDVFDPEFENSVERGIGWVTQKHGTNPLCIGYFIDNELSWGNDDGCSIAVWALRSPEDQPCRRVFVETLKSKYRELESLNQAWGADAESWAHLRVPQEINPTCRADLNDFIEVFCNRYFSTLAEKVKQGAPNQLYLGCRFSGFTRIAVEACARYADVISFNIYRRGVDPKTWSWLEKINKPAIIGEFHFGATDRGMFHPGLVEAKDQSERGAFYSDYVRSVAQHPNFVGCHWFQYIDEPITGRPHDGENYNIGFVDVTDSPYPELVNAARDIHRQVYNVRWNQRSTP